MENQIIHDPKTNQAKTVVRPELQMGTEQLPYTSFDIPAGSRMNFMAHWHPAYEIILQLDGHVEFMVDGTLYRLEPGEALFLHSGVVHGHADYNGSYGRYVCFSFETEFVSPDPKCYIYNRFFAPLSSGELSFTKHIAGKNAYEGEILEILRQLRPLNRNIAANALSIQVCLLRIFDILFRENALEPVRTPLQKKEIIKSALWYMNSNYTRSLTIEELSRFLNVSTDHFTRIFKAATASTPKEYILNLRIRHAMHEMSTDAALRLSEIAESAGFSDPNYFTRAFKNKTGITPTDYQKLLKAGPGR